MSNNRTEALANNLLNVVQGAVSAIKEIPANDFNHKPAADKWSKKEILGHLIDSAFSNIRRFVNTQYLDNPNIVYQQNEWVNRCNHQENDGNELLALWVALNKQASYIIKNIDPSLLQRECNLSSTGGELFKTLDWIIEDYIHHAQHHLKKILS